MTNRLLLLSHSYSDSCFIENKAGANGAALYILEVKRSVVKRSRFIRNRATLNGGATYIRSIKTRKDPYIKIMDSDFKRNEAGMQGGGVAIKGQILGVLSSCLFLRNLALAGGGVYNMATDPDF